MCHCECCFFSFTVSETDFFEDPLTIWRLLWGSLRSSCAHEPHFCNSIKKLGGVYCNWHVYIVFGFFLKNKNKQNGVILFNDIWDLQNVWWKIKMHNVTFETQMHGFFRGWSRSFSWQKSMSRLRPKFWCTFSELLPTHKQTIKNHNLHTGG